MPIRPEVDCRSERAGNVLHPFGGMKQGKACLCPRTSDGRHEPGYYLVRARPIGGTLSTWESLESISAAGQAGSLGAANRRCDRPNAGGPPGLPMAFVA